MSIKNDWFSLYDFSSIRAKKIFKLDEVKKILKTLVNNKGKLNVNLKKKGFIRKHNLLPFFETVYYYTNFLKKNVDIKERLFCIKSDMRSYPSCENCGDSLTTFQRNFTDGHYGKFCSRKCNRVVNHPWTGKPEEEKKKIGQRIGKTKRERGDYNFSEDHKRKLSERALSAEVKEKKRKTNLERHGVENAGVLGAFHSKSATEYIIRFLKERNISPDRCYYHDKENDKREFFQMIFVPFLEKKKYCSYDLIVFETKKDADEKNLDKIESVLEYNGPWHYLKEEVDGHENEKAVPYKNNNSYTYTKAEVYKMDKLKIEHMKKYAKEIYIYWERHKKLDHWIENYNN